MCASEEKNPFMREIDMKFIEADVYIGNKYRRTLLFI